ncbi:4Fe-4S double cluster binding domain-containing protein [Anaerocolumna sp. MB42-C2]|uniref:4Fe-4S double cluster binding domain-containing protein n=1 Tax=Anaerocolumna sp. MB42-C2 TaxID=3070997 RepID=UPI0027E086F6|nr:4Fe-4S double cluster binding domain-containing protein [Anaerocolumna sp. MB42-C2]WMJ87988.1 4Fe-4S double cluster binding domain-containing protein [Anaerocolumna sp. MB42-C2]
MNQEIERILLENGASMVGFAKIDELYSNVDLNVPRSEDTATEPINIPNYPFGISIILAHPKDVIKNIHHAPTMDYYKAYHRLNNKLDNLAILCAEYIKEQGYNAYPQTVSATKEYGIFRTVMPHKTVAVHAGLGWIGKSALFITEKYGSAVRLTSVLTDAPLEYNKQIMTSKCGSCMLCTSACPGKAISGRVWSPGLDRDEFFDAMACRKKAREIAAKTIDKQITLCGKCIEVCPYTRKYTLDI